MAAAASHWLIASALLFCALVGAAPAPDASAEEPSGLVGYKASVLHFIADPWDLGKPQKPFLSSSAPLPLRFARSLTD